MVEPSIAIGELSRLTGCNIETIRYYERIGLLPKPARRGRYRSYDRGDVGRLGFVRRSRELGFTLEAVRTLLGLAAGGHASCGEARDLAADHLKDVQAHLAEGNRRSVTIGGRRYGGNQARLSCGSVACVTRSACAVRVACFVSSLGQ